MQKILLKILDWTWCLPQNLIGFIFKTFVNKGNCMAIYDREYKYFLARGIKRFQYYSGKIWKIDSYRTDLKVGSITLGKYIFLADAHWYDKDVLLHEYGHVLQNYILGPLYLIVIGLPSLLWAGFIHKLVNKKKKVSYYSFYTEKWANKLVGIDLK